MHYRQFGLTAMHVSPLSLRASALGGIFADIDPAQGICTMHVEQLAVQFAVSHPGLATSLVNATCSQLMRQNTEWVQEPPAPYLLHEVHALLHPIIGRNLG